MLAIDDHMPAGNTFYASVSTLVVWTSISKKTIQRRIWGYSMGGPEVSATDIKRVMEQRGVNRKRACLILKEEQTERYRQAWLRGDRNVPYLPGLVDKNILKLIREGIPEERKAAMYTFNDAALIDNPRAMAIIQRRKQEVLPGFKKPLAPGHPIFPERQIREQISPIVPSGVSLTLEAGNPQIWRQPDASPRHSDARSGVSLTHPSVTETQDWRQSDARSSVRVTPEVRRNTVVVNTKPSTTDIPEEKNLAQGLRSILPTLDSHAVKTILKRCRKAAPDCTVDEILYFASQKGESVWSANTRNPAGLLIETVCRCFENGDIKALRQQLESERNRAQAAALQKAEHERREEEQYRQMEQRDKELERQINIINSLPQEQFQPLYQRAKHVCFRELPEIWNQQPREQLELTIRQFMRRIMFEGKDS